MEHKLYFNKPDCERGGQGSVSSATQQRPCLFGSPLGPSTPLNEGTNRWASRRRVLSFSEKVFNPSFYTNLVCGDFPPLKWERQDSDPQIALLSGV